MNAAIHSDATVSGPSPGAAGRETRIFCAMLLSGLLLAGVASLAASLVPFSVLLARVRSLSDSGQGTFFSPEFYRAMQMRLRFIGIANLAAGIFLLWFRRQMFDRARRVSSDALILARDFGSAATSLPAIDLLALACLVCFAAVLRIPLLSQPMRYDEAITFLEYASRPFYVALSFYSTPNNHLFHTLLVRLAYLALGNHPWALRLPTFLAGLCLVPATYTAARSLYRSHGALLAAALVASSSMLIEYSTNARGYCMVCLLFVMMIPVAAYAARHQNWAAWLLLAVVSALGFYTIPIMLYPFGGVVVWLLISIAIGDAPADAQPDTRSALAGPFVACVLTMLLAGELYSPVLAVSGPKAVFANKWVTASPPAVFLRQLPASLASTWRDWNRDLPMWLTVVLAAGFAISLLWHRRGGRQRVPLALALLLWVGPVVFAQRVIPFERVWLFALPLYFIGAAAGLAIALEPVFNRLHLRHAMALVAVVVAVFAGLRVERSGSVYLSSVYLTNESRGMPALAAWLKGQLKSGDAIVAVPPSDGPLRYYLQNEGVAAAYLASHIGAPNETTGPHRMFVVVNQVAGDTVERVCETARQPLRQGDAQLLVHYESAALYSVPFAPESH
jgi:4-amino-4-deoxy-L-arabinose transferase-like glycosyltransferase